MTLYIFPWNPGRFGNQAILLLHILAYSKTNPSAVILLLDMPKLNPLSALPIFPVFINDGKIYLSWLSSFLNRLVVFLLPKSLVNRLRTCISRFVHYALSILDISLTLSSTHDQNYHHLTSNIVFNEPFFSLSRLPRPVNSSRIIISLWGYKYRDWKFLSTYKNIASSELLSVVRLSQRTTCPPPTNPYLFLHIRGTDYAAGLPFTRVSPLLVADHCKSIFNEHSSLKHIKISSDDTQLALNIMNALADSCFAVSLTSSCDGSFKPIDFFDDLALSDCILANCSSLSFAGALLYSKPYYYIANNLLYQLDDLEIETHPFLEKMC